MAKCTCKKWGCESDCICNCHRENNFQELKELNNGLDRIEKQIDKILANK